MRWELEPNGEAVDATRTGPLQTGLYHYGVLTGADDRGNDYFHFNLLSAGTVELWLTNMAPGQDFNLTLRNASLDMVDKGHSGNLSNAAEHIVTGPLAAGRYYVQVSRVTGDSMQPYHLRGAWQANESTGLINIHIAQEASQWRQKRSRYSSSCCGCYWPG